MEKEREREKESLTFWTGPFLFFVELQRREDREDAQPQFDHSDGGVVLVIDMAKFLRFVRSLL